MKYLLTSMKPNNNTQLLLENVTPAKTRHIRGYGAGVTFSARCYNWKQDPTFATTKLLQYSEPTVVPQ